MYRIFNRYTNKTIATVVTSHSVTLDEAIALAGKYHNDRNFDEENVEINGNWYFYDDLDLEVCRKED